MYHLPIYVLIFVLYILGLIEHFINKPILVVVFKYHNAAIF